MCVLQGMVWLDGGDNEAALACFEEACTVDGANASVHSCKAIALVKVSTISMKTITMLGRRRGNLTIPTRRKADNYCVIG